MYHYFMDLDFRWCGLTLCELSQIVKCLRRIDSVWVYWTWMKCSDNYFPPLCTWEIPNSEVLGLRMGRNGQMELDRTVPTEKTGPPRKVDHFFRNFSGWTEPIHWKRHLAGFSPYMIKQQSIVLGETQDLSVLTMPRS